VEVQRAGAIPGGIDRIEHRVDILLITHTVKLAAPTDKNRRPVTTETKVTQGVTGHRAGEAPPLWPAVTGRS
ncbi:hypothetical protein, partial [Mycobacterium colombiense]|uniref:hypothetical protein n=1 Tax=Mycobacterium colombiense TaxID=339268 RepID=UPI000A7DDDB8